MKHFLRLAGELLKPAETSQLYRAELSQPICTAVQIALVNALARCNIQPDAVVGHSSGEIAAAYAAGGLCVVQAMTIAYYRGYKTVSHGLNGGMAVIGLDAASTSDYLTSGVVVACENSPKSTTISGDLHAVMKMVNTIEEQRPQVFVRQLHVDMAYHSRKLSVLHWEVFGRY